MVQTRRRTHKRTHRRTYNRDRTTRKAGIGPLRKGNLVRFGYQKVAALTEGRRHLALAAAVHRYGALSVWRKLNAVYVYTRNTAPASSAVFKADRDWVKAHYGI